MTFAEAMVSQAEFCERSAAPIAARVCRALAGAIDRSSETGTRALDWSGDYAADAVPLRLAAPLHALARRGTIPALSALFAGRDGDDLNAVRRAIAAHDNWIARWLDGPPQTNEPARSAAFMGALLVLAKRFKLPFDLLEIGSSGGLNLLIDRYRYNLGGVGVGPLDASVTITPAWRGVPPPVGDVVIERMRGVDIAPVDVRDPAAAERLLAYVWVDAPERVARVEGAIAMIRASPVDLVQGDAADWVEARLAEPQPPGTCRVLMHSVVWPYLDAGRRERIEAAMRRAGTSATDVAPLAWVSYEWGEHHGNHQIVLRSWPGDRRKVLGEGHPHAAWINWSSEEFA